jgi:charged multivesicular body protein 6
MGGCQSKASFSKEDQEEFNQVSSRDRAILALKVQRDRLRQYQERIFTILDEEKKMAMVCLVEGDRTKALFILKRKKYQERLLGSIAQNLKVSEQMVDTIEYQQVQNCVYQAFKHGNEILAKLQAEINVQDLQVMDEELEKGNFDWYEMMKPEVDEELEEELFDIQLELVKSAEAEASGLKENAERAENEAKQTEEAENTEESIQEATLV